MKLLSLNLHCYMEENQLDKFEKISDYIFSNSIDIVFFQEVGQLIDSPTVFDNIKKDNSIFVIQSILEQKYNKKYNFYCDFTNIGFDKFDEGIGILTPHNIEEKRSFYISKTNSYNTWNTRKIVEVKVDAFENYFYSCHTGFLKDKTDNIYDQYDRLHKELKPNSILGGDFNNGDKTEPYKYLMSKGLRDLYIDGKEIHTFEFGKFDIEYDNKQQRIDFILTNIDNLKLKDYKIEFKAPNKVSDHYGVYVEIEV